ARPPSRAAARRRALSSLRDSLLPRFARASHSRSIYGRRSSQASQRVADRQLEDAELGVDAHAGVDDDVDRQGAPQRAIAQPQVLGLGESPQAAAEEQVAAVDAVLADAAEQPRRVLDGRGA